MKDGMFSFFIRRSCYWRFGVVITFLGGTSVLSAATVPPSKTGAAKPAAERPERTSAGSAGKHCLWRVTNTPAPFYLLGSVHTLRSSDYPLAPVVEQAISDSRQYYFEVDPAQQTEFEKKLHAACQYPNGVQIKSKVRPETYKTPMRITSNGANTWQHLKPWAIAMFMLRHPAMHSVSYAYGVEHHIYEKAHYWQRPTHGLESVDEHVNVLAGMNDHESEVFLLEALVFADASAKGFPQEVAAWKAGDTERLYNLQKPLMPDIVDAPGLNARLLYDRNARWIPRIEAAMKSGKPTMIVAGAMHFSGTNNVIALLQKRGYKIEQL